MIRSELVKQLARPQLWMAGALLVAFTVAVSLLADGEVSRGPGVLTLYNVSAASGLNNGLAGLAFFSQAFVPIAIALAGGQSIASEAASGVLRYLCVRPVSRISIVATKLAATAVVGSLLVVAVVVTAVIAGTVRYGWNPVLHLDLATSSAGAGSVRLLAATGYVCLAMASVAAIAVALSTLVDQPVAPVVGAIVIVIASHIADGSAALDAVDDVLPTHYWNAWTTMFGARVPMKQLAVGAASATGWLITSTLLAGWRMRSRDIH